MQESIHIVFFLKKVDIYIYIYLLFVFFKILLILGHNSLNSYGMFSCGEMTEWERKGERRVFSWGEENGGRRVFPQAHHLREKNFLPNLGRS